MSKETLFISYNWRDGNVYADELEMQLKDYFVVKRDKSQLIANDDIFDFMAEIATCDNVIIVLTSEYVKSVNCMLEMAYMFDQPDWKMKVTVLVIDETIYSTEKKIEIINYWMLRERMNGISLNEINSGARIINEEQEYIKQICNQVEEFLIGVSRRKNPSQIAIVNEVIKKSKNNRENKKEMGEKHNQTEQVVLDYIKRHSDVTVKELCEKELISMATASRYISNLKSKKLIELNEMGNGYNYCK